MPRVIVAEDSPTQAAHVKFLLDRAGYAVEIAQHGGAALAAIERQRPDLVLTDLVMPEMNGLQLVQEVRRRYPLIPTILMTHHGSEEIAAEALQKGAAGYIPKRRIEDLLLRTLQNVLGMSHADRTNQQLVEAWSSQDSLFVLDNSPGVIPHLVAHFRETLQLMGICDEVAGIRVSVALTEALDNALFHGNLELSSDLREGDGRAWHQTALQRRQEEPYRSRKIWVSSRMNRERAMFVIRDEGRGFDPADLPDPSDPANLDRASGRGIMLIRTFMDEVRYAPDGKELTLVKRRGSGG